MGGCFLFCIYTISCFSFCFKQNLPLMQTVREVIDCCLLWLYRLEIIVRVLPCLCLILRDKNRYPPALGNGLSLFLMRLGYYPPYILHPVSVYIPAARCIINISLFQDNRVMLIHAVYFLNVHTLYHFPVLCRHLPFIKHFLVFFRKTQHSKATQLVL